MNTGSSAEGSTTWRLDGGAAHLDCGTLRATVDVATPNRGLSNVSYRGAPLGGWLLGVDIDAPGTPSDVYVRGADLVATYREKPERPFTVQVYWSACEELAGGAVILDATVSIQTRQWEAYPRVTVGSPMEGGGEVIVIDATALVVRPPGVDWSYLEVTAPEDFMMLSGGEGRRSQEAHWMFGEQFMERGVIRKLRLRGAFVPRGNDLGAAGRLRDALRAEQPPLTT